MREGPEPFEQYSIGLLFDRLDKDQNGSLNKTELKEYERFQQALDTDRDELITKSEFLRLRAAIRNMLTPVSPPK